MIFRWDCKVVCNVPLCAQLCCMVVNHEIHIGIVFTSWTFLTIDVCIISLALSGMTAQVKLRLKIRYWVPAQRVIRQSGSSPVDEHTSAVFFPAFRSFMVVEEAI